MEVLNDIPNIKYLFKNNNLEVQPLYRAKEEYDVIYINPNLYEEIFEEKYNWNTAVKKIKRIFSITLDKGKSNNELLGDAFSDKQVDPNGIALSGNLGSGRAFFYKDKFNIKGDKTNLATSPKAIYSNGKYALSASIKETVIANILSYDFIIKTFETLAILSINEKFEFEDEYLDENDIIKTAKYNLPCSIEIRVNKDKELYRISNSLINKDEWDINKIQNLSKNLAKIEANKFCDRFLHGSWSVGNISTEGNLIDFDTSTFVKGRYPQYSNTNKYKSNYFGYELIGQKIMLKTILGNNEIKDLEKLIDEEYRKNLKIKFCALIGLDYNVHYHKYNKYIDSLCESFDILSRKFLPNYYETNVIEPNGDVTYLFDFSRFFQKYLIYKNPNKNNILLGTRLLINDTKYIEYKKVGMIKKKVEEHFKNDLVNESNIDYCINKAIDFIEEYDELFSKISKEVQINDIIIKQYTINSERNYLYGNKNIYGDISYLYDTKQIDNNTTNKIINALIKTNIKNNYNNEKKIKIGLKLYKDFLTYWIISKNSYNLVIEPFPNINIEFAKAIIDKEERMMKHCNNENDEILISEDIEYKALPDILNFDIHLKINGREYKEEWL